MIEELERAIESELAWGKEKPEAKEKGITGWTLRRMECTFSFETCLHDSRPAIVF